MKDYVYRCCCIDLFNNPPGVEGLNKMIEDNREVKYDTMRARCQKIVEWAKEHGYKQSSRLGLALRNDWHVSYHKSTFLGDPCYYLVWSHIEFIWVKPKEPRP